MAPTEVSLEAQHVFNLDGAVAVVTGGGTGIGLMAAKTLAANGAKVYITGRRQNVLEQAVQAHSTGLRGSLVAIQADVTSKEDLKHISDSIEEKKIHILINNAGVEGPTTRLTDPHIKADEASKAHLKNEDFEAWNKLFTVNTSGIFFATMALLPLLEAGNASPPSARANRHWSSSVINITSISGQVKLSQNHYGYNASKAAANSLTMMMAHEFNFGNAKSIGVRVNALAPGLFASEMTSAGKPSLNGVTDPTQMADHANPAGRIGDADEMGSTVLFLATNAFVNGQVLAVDGGFVTAVASSR